MGCVACSSTEPSAAEPPPSAAEPPPELPPAAECPEYPRALLSDLGEVLVRGRPISAPAHVLPGSPFASGLVRVNAIWKTEDATVIAVDSGSVLTPVGVGQTRLVASACGVADTVMVRVESEPLQFAFLGDSTVATALNDSGDVVGYTRRHGFTYWLWHSGLFTFTPGCRTVDVNNRRDALCEDGGPTVWRNGALEQLDFYPSTSLRINDSGQVLMTMSGQPGPVLWTGFGQVEPRGEGHPIALNNSGDVLLGRFGSFRSYHISDGVSHRVTSDHTYIQASDLNDSRIVVGYLKGHGLPDWEYHAVSWHPNVPIFTGSALRPARKNLLVNATIVNNRGDIGGSGRAGAFLIRNDRLYLLSHVIADSAWVVLGVTDLNERGELIGLVRNAQTGAYGSALISLP